MPTRAKTARAPKRSWKQIFTPPTVIATFLGAVCVVMIIVSFLNPGTKAVSVTSPVEHMQPMAAITPEDRLVQTFTAADSYSRFGLYYANFGNYMQGGELHIDVRDSKKVTTQFVFNIGGVSDNAFVYVDYPLLKNEAYTVTIYITGTAQGITFFTTTADNYNAQLQRDRKPQDFSIIMSFVSTSPDTFAAWYYIMALALILCYVVLKLDKDVYGQEN